jgi:rubrerythrin
MPKNFDYRDYSVIRLPATFLPPGFMDEKTLSRAQATVSRANFLLEYGCVFVSDSDGFYKRSLIESCVVGRRGAPISHPSCSDVFFKGVLKGRPGCQYVIAMDPASQQDNFAVLVLEVWPDHRRVVYCWTSKQSEYEAVRRKGLTNEKTFYAFCARKVRQLLRDFSPCVRLAIDLQGGGHAVIEAMNNSDRLAPGERYLYPFIDPEDPKDTDDMAGDHILDLVQFANAKWTSFANHGMKKDFEDKVLLFPYWDQAETAMALEHDKEAGRVKVDPETGEPDHVPDTLEACVESIEELKNELSYIVHTETGAGREQWDLPERKAEGSNKGRLRKDRYSALVMANAAARRMLLHPEVPLVLPAVGGAAHLLAKGKGGGGGAPIGPDWWARQAGGFHGAVVKRGG